MKSTSFAALLALIPVALAQQSVWGQCGGIGWTGPTTCQAGDTCEHYNDYYYQCVPNSILGTSTTSSSSSTTRSTTTTTTSSTKTTVSTTTTTTTSVSPPPTGSGINVAAKAAGKLYFGTATDANEFDEDSTYLSILSNGADFGQLTPANSMKWQSTEPTQGQYTFTQANELVALAKQLGYLIRGHNCVWYNQLPSWLTSGSWTAAQLTSIIQEHCSTIVGQYKGEIDLLSNFRPLDAWDVINEPFNDDGTWRSDIFYNTLNTQFIPIALNAARGADANAKLYINDYNIEYVGAKATSMVNLVKSLQAAGTPIDGVGFQCHFIVGEVPTNTVTVMNQITALGVEVAITELDIRMSTPASTQNQNQQVTDYGTAIKNCATVSKCVGVTVWDFTDKYSWVPSTFSGQGDACIWDSNLQKKQAVYNAVVAAF